MKYFWVLWRNKDLSLVELKALWWKISHTENWCVIFQWPAWLLSSPGFHPAWLTKWWELQDQESFDIDWFLQWVKLVWVNEKKWWVLLKKSWLKRFKENDLTKTDQEVREKWKELIIINDTDIGVVSGYQNISFFEAIDFEKPVSGMQIGMMPAKLTQILIWVGLWMVKEKKWSIPTIFDPFCGFWTTWFVANWLWYNFLWSDINPTPTKQNMTWLQQQERFHPDLFFTVFKHDVKELFTQPYVKNASVIVSEWWLWPIITTKASKQLQRQELNERRDSITSIYVEFLKNCNETIPSVPIIITFPQRTFLDEDMSSSFFDFAKELWYHIEQVWELYLRKKQLVARRILRVRKK